MKMIIIGVAFLGFVSSAWSESFEKGLMKKEYLTRVDSFYDPTVDYSRFPGRVSDKNRSTNILKIYSENKNIRFFRAGDEVNFLPNWEKIAGECRGNVRRVEEDHFVIYVNNINQCWPHDDYFRRGTQLDFHSPKLADRVKDAGQFRRVLIKRKNDFLRQLSEVNHFLWSYSQKRIQLAAEYDQKIVEIEKEKNKAMDSLQEKKREFIGLQKELATHLNALDKDLDFNRIDKEDYLKDRWAADRDLGLPVGSRPQKLMHTEY